MKRVIVSGAGGFIGRHTLPKLVERGFEVHALTREDPSDKQGHVQWHRVDLFDCASCVRLVESVRPTHLLHLAWDTQHGKYWSSPANVRWVEASLILMRAFAEHGGQRAVCAGTCAEYDWTTGFCDEDHTALKPTSIYGTCKHALSELLAAYSKSTGLSSAWGRLFFLFGPGENSPRLVPSVINRLLRNENAHCSSANLARDFLYVEDAADAFSALLDCQVAGPLNIASGESVQIRWLAGAIARKLERPDLVLFDLPPGETTGPEVMTATIRRLATEVGWTPRISIEEGISRTIQWWKTHGRR